MLARAVHQHRLPVATGPDHRLARVVVEREVRRGLQQRLVQTGTGQDPSYGVDVERLPGVGRARHREQLAVEVQTRAQHAHRLERLVARARQHLGWSRRPRRTPCSRRPPAPPPTRSGAPPRTPSARSRPARPASPPCGDAIHPRGRACRYPVVEPVETPAVEPVETRSAVEPVETPVSPAVEPVETRHPGGRACRDPTHPRPPRSSLSRPSTPGGRACRDPTPAVEPVETPRWSSLSRPSPLHRPALRPASSTVPDLHATRPTLSRARSSAWLGPTSSDVQTAPTTSGVRRTSWCASTNTRRVEVVRTQLADARSSWFGPRSSRESPKPSGSRSRSRTGLARSAKHSSKAGSLICPPSLVDGRGGPRGGRGLDRLDHRHGSTGSTGSTTGPGPTGCRVSTGSTTGPGLDRLDHRVSTGSTTGRGLDKLDHR